MTTSYDKIRTRNLGTKHSWINAGITSNNTIITIRAWNWVPVEKRVRFYIPKHI